MDTPKPPESQLEKLRKWHEGPVALKVAGGAGIALLCTMRAIVRISRSQGELGLRPVALIAGAIVVATLGGIAGYCLALKDLVKE